MRPAADEAAVKSLQESLGVDAVIAALLVNRGITNFDKARTFFRPDPGQMHNPFLMTDMQKAVDRLAMAFSRNEKVLVYGDYDVDGTTAVTVVYSFLKKMGMDCDYYIPDRYSEGYGFSFAGVEFAKAQGHSLIITLDCGIRDNKKIEFANSFGIDVIVCDHHHPTDLPPAVAVLDPHRPDCRYPFKGLSGCGVGFKMLQAFCISQNILQEEVFCYLDLLTISIGADIVPMTDENRVLATLGLRQLAGPKRPGITALLQHAGFKKQVLNISDVVFVLAPRINAAGRIYSGKQAVQLLLADTLDEAIAIAPAIEKNNTTRKGLDKEITVEAIEKISTDEFNAQSFSTVVYSEGWHKGVLGIVASRLVDKFYKPAIVLSKIDDKLAGSARSIPGIDLFEALDRCHDLLDHFGGHAMAAGLGMSPQNFPEFRLRFDSVVAEMLVHNRPKPLLEVDAEIDLNSITPKFFRVIQQFQPFGPENMKPVFLTRNVTDAGYTRAVGATANHLKFHLKQNGIDTINCDGIGFNFGQWAAPLKEGASADIVYTLEENEWNGNSSVQLNIRDMKITELQKQPA